MPTMCGIVARGKLMDDFEAYVNGNTTKGGHLTSLSQALEDPDQDVNDVFDLIYGSRHPQRKMKNHLESHWFSDGASGFWPHNEHKQEIIRHGLAEAVKTSKSKGRPISLLWICAGHHFQVAIHESPAQITVLILTPSTPDAFPHPPSKKETKLCMIGSKREIAEICREAENTKGRPTDGDCKPLDSPHRESAKVWLAPIFQD